MARAELVPDVAVVLAFLIDVFNQQANRRAGSHALEYAGEDFYLIRFAPRAVVPRGAGPPPVKFRLQVSFAERHARRTTVHNGTNSRPVAFTKAGYGKQFANAVARHLPVPV